tara:strand:+ start:238 stop:1281 length:1044 start_codon:yes stop_codon:yes gene_type:complete
MAKDKKTTTEPESDIMFDGLPGADTISAEEASKEFAADLNFDNPEDEVEFPQEDEIEEISETELTADTEETEEGEPEETETEALEAESDTEEVGEQETVLEQDEGDTQQAERAVPTETTKEPMIPKSRFDEVLAKQKALQKKLDEASAPQIEDIKEAPKYDFDSKEIEYQNLVLDGESTQAVQLRSEIRQAEKQQMMFEMQAKMGQTMTQTTEMQDLQAKANEIQTAFPTLDENNASYDEAKTNEVMELRDAYMMQGYAGADALQKATTLIMGQVETTTQPDPNIKKVQQKKQQANVSKKIQASESQPPAMKGQNKTDKKVDLNVLSTEEFDALPAETLRRMRGDFG